MATRLKREGIMLAHPATDKRLSHFGELFFTQPKLRGVRCRVEWFHGEPVLLSSYGEGFRLIPHIKEELLNNFPNGYNLDGELYVHGWTQEEINSVVKRSINIHKEFYMMEYHIFDIISDEIQAKRIAELLRFNETEFIKIVPTTVDYPNTWIKRAEKYLRDGYEGLIFRHTHGFYEEKRSSALLKFKPTEVDKYTIVGVSEGEGWAEGMLGSFLVKDSDGKMFHVGSGPTKEERRSWWKIRNELIGKTLVVKHEQARTAEGIPLCTKVEGIE